jgi:hypothetical protein
MLILKKLNKYLKLAFLLAVLCFFSACGKKTPPPPPKSRSELVLEIFELLKNKDHEVVMKKISRLRELDPTNVFLANLEIVERNNMIICQAQKEINKGDLANALEKINEGIKKYGRHKDLMVAQQKLTVAARIEEILEIFKAPNNSSQLKDAAIQLKEIGNKYKPAVPFVPIAIKNIKLAEEKSKWETKRGIESFCSYIDTMIDQEDPDTKLLFAILEVVDPYNTTLLNYLDYLKGNENLSLKTYVDEEDLFSSDYAEEGTGEEGTGNDLIMKEEDTSQPKTKIEENKTGDKEKGWWNKFTF